MTATDGAAQKGGAWVSTKPAIRTTLEQLSWDAEGVWHACRLWSASVGSDGVVPYEKLHVAVARKIPEGRVRKVMPELVGADLVKDTGTEYQFDWSDQPRAEVWQDPVKRERWARAKRLGRDSELCRRIKSRDRNLCRYCGIRVDWNNKVGPVGGTYDHIDPDGENDLDNVVVSCRRCNGRKRDRTPQQAGMTLYRAGTTAEQIAEMARGPSPPGSTPGQPPVDPGLTPATRSRARPDRVNPGLTPGQPNPRQHPVGFSRASAPLDDRPPPHTDVDAPPEVLPS